jgi:type I restriction enzyme S subunit
MSKKDKNKLIPELRFTEFENEGEWVEKTLGDVGDFIGGGTPDTSRPEYWTGNIQWYTPTEVKEGRLSKSIRTITEKGLQNSSAKLLPKGVILITTRATIGDIAIANFECTTNQGFQSLIVNISEINTFWYYWILHHKRDLIHKSSGSTFPEIGKNEIAKINVLRPSPNEQKKIASCLSSLDEVIAAHSQKLDALKEHKKGLMQNLFPQEGEAVPRYRFKEFANDGDWEEKKLGDKEVSFFVSEKISVNKLNINSYISTENMFPEFSGVSVASKLPSSGSFTKFNNGDILISNIRPYLKKVWKSDKTGGASNDVLVFRSGSEVLSQFLEFIFKNEVFINYVMESAKGVKMPRGDRDSMQKYIVFIPSKFEQQKIASCLSSLDELITAEAEKIAQLKLHKKGLMQGLFPKSITN